MSNSSRLTKFLLIPLLGLVFFIQPTTANAGSCGKGNAHPSQVFVFGKVKGDAHSSKDFNRNRGKPQRYSRPYNYNYRYPMGRSELASLVGYIVIVLGR